MLVLRAPSWPYAPKSLSRAFSESARTKIGFDAIDTTRRTHELKRYLSENPASLSPNSHATTSTSPPRVCSGPERATHLLQPRESNTLETSHEAAKSPRLFRPRSGQKHVGNDGDPPTAAFRTSTVTSRGSNDRSRRSNTDGHDWL